MQDSYDVGSRTSVASHMLAGLTFEVRVPYAHEQPRLSVWARRLGISGCIVDLNLLSCTMTIALIRVDASVGHGRALAPKAGKSS
jgi:hypothetical protein